MPEISKQRWTLALTSLAAFIVVLDTQVMTVALAAIRTDLHASFEALQWTVNAYTLTFAVLLLTGAALGDRFGRRRVFVSGLALFLIASAGCALAPDARALIIARAIQGVGGALILPIAITLLSMAYAPAQRGRALGLFNSFTGLALICGPAVGGAITQGFDWHAIFWLNVPLALAAIVLVLARIDDSAAESTHFDLGGLALATAAAFALVWGCVRAGTHGWSDAPVLVALVSGSLTLVAFVAWERRTNDPMIPMRLFATRAFAAGNVTNVLFNGAMYGTLFFLAQFLQTAHHETPFGAGLRVLPWTATLFVIAPFAGALSDRIGNRALVVAGMALQGCGLAWLAAIATPNVPYVEMVLPLVIAGAGVSLAMPANQRMVLNAASRADLGKSSGTFTMLRYLGGIFGVAVLVTVFDRFGGTSSPAAFTAGFGPAMWGAAVLSFLASAAAIGATEARESFAPSPSSSDHDTHHHSLSGQARSRPA